ncbi:MAG: tetratricopeptide repeat protein [Bradymonadia bacterium]
MITAIGQLFRPRLLWAMLLIMAALASPTEVYAQKSLLSFSNLGTQAEREAIQSLDEEKWARARRQAEAILKDGPSFLATYVLAMVHFEAEGNLARALFLMRQSLKQLVELHGSPPTDVVMRVMHQRIMREEMWLLGQMDDREGQLASIDRLEALYQSVEVYRMWPLVKLGRFDEARAIGNRLIHDEDQDIRERAYNSMMAVEDEARNRKASYDWGKKGNRITRGGSCIISTNLALAARRCFDLDEAITFDKQALKATDGSCPTSPYGQLSLLYLMVGEFQKGLSALKSLREIPQKPRQKVQNEMFIRSRMVELLLALNQSEKALPRAEEIIRNPDRKGMDSASEEIRRLEGLVLYWATAQLETRRLEARAAVRDFWDGLKISAKAEALAMSRWKHQRLAISLATHGTVMRDMARPYYSDAQPWFSGVIADLLGDGIWEKAIDEARAIEVDFPKKAGAFLDGMSGELKWRAGDHAAAIVLGEQALAGVPDRAKLFRRRIMTWLADAYIAQGEHGKARGHLHTLLRLWPTSLPLLGVKLPAAIVHDDSALATEVADRLQDSPWLAPANDALGFQVSVTQPANKTVKTCILGSGGFQYACVLTSVDILRREATAQANTQKAQGQPQKSAPSPRFTPEPLKHDSLAVVAADRFHERAFAPKLELTQTDLNSLDGRATRVDADQALQEIMGPRDLVNHR